LYLLATFRVNQYSLLKGWLSILAGEIGVGASFMTPWQPVDLRTGVMNDAPTPTTNIPLKDREPKGSAY